MDIHIKRIGAWILTLCMVVSLTPGRLTAFAVEEATDEVSAAETEEAVDTADAEEAEETTDDADEAEETTDDATDDANEAVEITDDADEAEETADEADEAEETTDDADEAEETTDDATDEADTDADEAEETAEEVDDETEDAALMAVAKSYYVGTFAELKEAIDKSNASDDGSFVVNDVTYTSITLENKEHKILVEQELVIEKTLTIDLALVGLVSVNNPTTADKGTHRIFTVKGNLTLTASEGCPGITGGAVSDNGGAILVEQGATLTLKDAGYLTIHDGKATNGGGVYVAGTFKMQGDNGQIYRNEATNGGGGVYVAEGGKFPLKAGLIGGNTTEGNYNKATNGGGVYIAAGGKFTLESDKALIKGNTANNNGGGVYIDGGTLAMFGNAAITTNNAANGGGVYVAAGTFELSGVKVKNEDTLETEEATTNATISGNKAVNGGGVYFADGTFNLNDGGKIDSNEADNAGGGVYVNKTGFTLNGGEITNNKVAQGLTLDNKNNVLSQEGKAKGGGVFVNSGITFNLNRGKVTNNVGKEIKKNTAEIQNDVKSNVYLFGTYNTYLSGDNKRASDTARIVITGDLSGGKNLKDNPGENPTKIGLTVEAFEMDDDHLALYISGNTSDGTNSYATSNKDNKWNTNISKFITADNDDWAIVLVNDDHIEIQDEFTTTSRVAIAINQWKYLQDTIFRAVTGNSSNSIVVVSQNVTPQDNDNRLIIGDPYNARYQDEKIVPYQGVKEPLEEYSREQDKYRKQITLDLHGYSVNRLLYDPDKKDENGNVIELENPKGDGYVIRVDAGYELTIINVRSDKIGQVTGGKDNGQGQGKGGGIYVESGGALVLSAGDVSGNYAQTSTTGDGDHKVVYPGNGGGVYVDAGAAFHMNGATSKVTKNKADANGGGVYIAGAPMNVDVPVGDNVIKSGVEFAYGAIYENHADNGGGIYVNAGGDTIKLGGKDADNKDTFTEIFKNTAENGGGVYVESGVVELTNSVSKLYENTASNEGGGVFVKGGVNGAADNAEFKITLGEITNNTANVNGGGVAAEGKLTMSGGVIADNKATQNGGGVFVVGRVIEWTSYDGQFDMTNGVIRKNTAANGGGVYVQAACSANANGKFTLTGPAAIGGENEATGNGGGVYLSGKPAHVVDGKYVDFNQMNEAAGGGVFEINGASITGNKAGGDGGGVYAGNSFLVKGTVSIQNNTSNNVYLPDATEVLAGLRTKATVQQIVIQDVTDATKIGVTLPEKSEEPEYIMTFTQNFFTYTVDAEGNPVENNGTFNSTTGVIGIFFSDLSTDTSAITVPTGDTTLEATILKPHKHTVHWHDGSTTEGVVFKPLITSSAASGNKILYYLRDGKFVAGNYYLYDKAPYTTELRFQQDITIDTNVSLCLNGVNVGLGPGLSQIKVTDGGNFSLFNFGSGDKDFGASSEKGVLSPAAGYTFTKDVIVVDSDNAEFNMYGGNFRGITTTGSVVKVEKGIFDISGGSISNNTTGTAAIYVESYVYADAVNRKAFKLHGTAQVCDNTGGVGLAAGDVEGTNYGGIYVVGNQGAKDKSNFWMFDTPVVQRNKNTYNNGNIGRNIYLNNINDTETTAIVGSGQTFNGVSSIYIYAYMDIEEPIRIAVAKTTQSSDGVNVDYHPITSDYSRIHKDNLAPENGKKASYVTKPQFRPEEEDLYPSVAGRIGYVIDFMPKAASKTPSTTSEFVLWEHTHTWNFYRDESTKRLYAYCEENPNGSNCEFAWKLEKDRNLDDVSMVKQLQVKIGGNFVDATAQNEGSSVVPNAGTINIQDYFRSVTPDGKKEYIAQIRSQDAIHIADPEKGNPTDPLNWIDTGGQATLQDGHKYVAVFLATYRQVGSNVDLNSPCVEFQFTVGNASKPNGGVLDFDGDGKVKMPEDFFSVYDKYLSYWANEQDTVGEDATKRSLDFNNNGVLDMVDLQKVFTQIFEASLTAGLSSGESSALDFESVSLNFAEMNAVLEAGTDVNFPEGDVFLLGDDEDTVAPKIEVGSVSGTPGSRVFVPVNLTANPGIAFFSLTAKYPEGWTLTSIEQGSNLPGTFTKAVEQKTAGWSNFTLTGFVNWTGTGELFQLVFNIPETAADGTYDVTVSLTNGAESLTNAARESIGNSLTITPGKVSVAKPTAEGTVEIQIAKDVVGKAGEKVYVPVTVTKNPRGFSAYLLAVKLPSDSALTFSGIKTNDKFPDVQRSGQRRVLWRGANAYTGEGDTLFELEFTINEGAADGSQTVELELAAKTAANFINGETEVPVSFTAGSVKVDSTAHTHNMKKVEAVAPTCEVDGNKEYWTCDGCNKLFSDAEAQTEITRESVTIKATGHDWGDWVVTKAATEDAEGVETRTCKNDASHTETRQIPKVAHTHKLTKTEAVAATCEKDGNIAYWTCNGCNKLFSDAEGKSEITQAETVVKAKGHDWGDWVVTKAATENAEGVETRTCKNDASHTETRAIPKTTHEHKLTKTEAVAATCEKDGNIAYWTCSVCGKLFSDAEGKSEITQAETVVKAKGHDWGDWVVTKAATEDAEGLETRTCKNDASHTETRTIPKSTADAEYNVTVTEGTGSGKHKAQDSVSIAANDAPDGMVFDKWLGADGLTFTDGSQYSASATFTMPSNHVDLTATFRTQTNDQGCYVATAVYGSYDCPEVWTLRRFRDNVLAKTWYGRLFIRLYYAVSPTAVKLFGNCEWFQNFFRDRLDKMVSGLQSDGFESTPYQDRAW